MRHVKRRRQRVRRAAARARVRAAATTPVATTTTTTIEPRCSRTTRTLRTHPARAIARPRATRTTRRLRPTQPTRPRPVRRRPRTTRQPTTRTTRTVPPGTATTTGNHHTRCHTRTVVPNASYRPQIRRTTTTATRTSRRRTTIPPCRSGGPGHCSATPDVGLQHLTTGHRQHALHTTTIAADQGSGCLATRTVRIDTESRDPGGHREALHGARARVTRGRRPRWRRRYLGRLRRLVTRRVNNADLVVVGRANRQALVAEAIGPDRRRTDQRGGIRRRAAVDLVVRRVGDVRLRPANDVVALPTRGSGARHVRRRRVRQLHVAAGVGRHREGPRDRERCARAGYRQRVDRIDGGICRVLDGPAVERKRAGARDVDPRSGVVVGNRVVEAQ